MCFQQKAKTFVLYLVLFLVGMGMKSISHKGRGIFKCVFVEIHFWLTFSRRKQQ